MTRSQIEFTFGLAIGDRNTFHTQRADRLIKMPGEDLVSVMDQILMRASLPDDRSQLLQRPIRGRLRCHIDVGQPTRAGLDDNKHVQHPKRCSDGHEAVAGEDHLGMVVREGGPALIAARLGWWSLRDVFANRSRRDPNPERLTKSSLAIRSSTHNGFSAAIRRIKRRGSGGTGGRPRPAFPAPGDPLAKPVPADDGCRLHVDHGVAPIEHIRD